MRRRQLRRLRPPVVEGRQRGLRVQPGIAPDSFDDGLNVRVVGLAEARIVGDTVYIFSCEKATLEWGEDCEAKTTTSVEVRVFELLVDLVSTKKRVAWLFDDRPNKAKAVSHSPCFFDLRC